ncbi:MAG: hypothetical protein COU69_02135 [Candidatus Pacebacteria bacterium CG10_big_fil_rev_8_21_14_0_10_56_10]|nr:MAG: hypothetical protein COU69_02135 [Candidatus Pacebacteria bacterium CG10_big_fil_rev_8_21_14_0_10_56_10]
MNITACQHFPSGPARPRADKCEGGDDSTSLRVCLTCGHVGCCESSPGQHAQKHAAQTGHQVMAAYPADQTSFIWCYAHRDYLEPTDEVNLNRG